MKMTFRWYGKDDPVTLEQIRQIPGMTGVVSAIYDTPVGTAWSLESIQELKKTINDAGLEFEVVESVPVHEDIKLGLPTRDEMIENYCTTLKRLASVGVKVVCYNFMPVFDWTRSDLNFELADGSTALIYDADAVAKMDPNLGELSLPGWDSSFTKESMKAVLDQYKNVTEEDLWNNLKYFLERVCKVADEVGIKMAIHPDDPPWGIFGLPRIITGAESLRKLVKLVDRPSNGITLCTGSLGANPENDMPAMIREFGDRIYFAHCRNIKITGERCFEESGHLSENGSLDMAEIMQAYRDIDFKYYCRPDHGRMIWGETGRPGYGLYDRALGAAYINGLFEACEKANR